MSEPRTLAELHAHRKSVKETQELLDSKRRGPLKDIAMGAADSASMPAFAALAQGAIRLPSANTFEQEKELIRKRLEAGGMPAEKLEALATKAVERGELNLGGTIHTKAKLLEEAAQSGFKAEKVPMSKLFPHAVRGATPGLVAAALAAGWGGMKGYRAYSKKRGHADELLREAENYKTASTKASLSLAATDAFWSEVRAIEAVQNELRKLAHKRPFGE